MLTKAEQVQQSRSFAEHQRAHFLGMALTRLELEILTRTAHGDMAKDIARLRGTSIRTIEAQMRTIHLKLGSRSKAHAVALAMSAGLINWIAVPDHLLPEPVEDIADIEVPVDE